MKLAVLGATGPSGQCVVEQALKAGHHVNALVRSPNKIKIKHVNLQVLETNIFSTDSLTKGMEGSDAVISCLGFRPTCCTGVTSYSASIATITASMRASKINRLVTMTSYNSRPSDDEGFCFTYLVRRTLIGTVLSDMAQMEDYLQDACGDIMWTVVKPPGLNLKPLDPRQLHTVEGQNVPESMCWMPRANVAKFMLEQLTDKTWHSKMVAIGYLKKG